MRAAAIPTKSVTVFKNHLSHVVKTGKVQVLDGKCSVLFLQSALFGSLQFKADGISCITSQFEEVVSDDGAAAPPKPVGDFAALLALNLQRRVTVATDTAEIEGTVLSVSPESQLCQIETTSGKFVFLHCALMRSVTFSEAPETNASKKVAATRVDIHFDPPSGERELTVSYLQRGLLWVPVYSLELLSDSAARLVLSAEVVNTAEGLAGATVHFAVGSPNFEFAEKGPATLTSFPESVSSPQATALSALPSIPFLSGRHVGSGGKLPYQNSNAMMFSNQMISNSQVAPHFGEDDGAAPAAADDAESAGEFYLYTVPNVTLPPNARAAFPLHDATVAVSHAYECALEPDDTSSVRHSGAAMSFEPRASNVAHVITLTNGSSKPLTTAPVLVSDGVGGGALGQSLVKYTPPGRRCAVKLGDAPDVQVRESRSACVDDGVLRDGRRVYTRTTTTQLTATNTKSERVTLTVKKTVVGEITQTNGGEADIHVVGMTGRDPNNINDVTFCLELKPKSTQTISYVTTATYNN